MLGVLVVFAPFGRSNQIGGENECGPRAVAALVEELKDGPRHYQETLQRVSSNLKWYDRVADFIPIFGRSTFTWGIRRALEMEGLQGHVEMSPRELVPGQMPFIALVLEPGPQSHYLAVLEVTEDRIKTNDRYMTHEEFRSKWRWTWYWGFHIDLPEDEDTAAEDAITPR